MENTEQLPAKLVSVKEAARVLGVRPASIYLWGKEGRLRTVELGRRIMVPVAELERACTEGVAK